MIYVPINEFLAYDYPVFWPSNTRIETIAAVAKSFGMRLQWDKSTRRLVIR